jgi:hypothetical protein
MYSIGMRREAIPAPKLYALLDSEFGRVRDPACANCRMPLPFYRAPADEFTANWHIGTPKRCDARLPPQDRRDPRAHVDAL